MERERTFNPSASGSKPPGFSKPVWSELYKPDEGEWLLPWSCPVCVKCWLRCDEQGQPRLYVDNIGRRKFQCVNYGPYAGYVEIPDH